MGEEAESVQRVARQVELAYKAGDLASYAGLLDPAVTWGAPGEERPPCRTREQVLEWWRRAEQSGVRAKLSEVAVIGDRVLVGLVVEGTEQARARGGDALRWQLLTVRAGLVVDIVGFDQKSEALAWASRGEP